LRSVARFRALDLIDGLRELIVAVEIVRAGGFEKNVDAGSSRHEQNMHIFWAFDAFGL
jgi:hypothetical protein